MGKIKSNQEYNSLHRTLYLMIGFRHVQQLLYNCCEGIFITFELSTAFDIADCSLNYVFTSCMAYFFGFFLPQVAHHQSPLLLLHLPNFLILGWHKAPSSDLLCLYLCLMWRQLVSWFKQHLYTDSFQMDKCITWTSLLNWLTFLLSYLRFSLSFSNVTCLKLNSKLSPLQTCSHHSLPHLSSW